MDEIRKIYNRLNSLILQQLQKIYFYIFQQKTTDNKEDIIKKLIQPLKILNDNEYFELSLPPNCFSNSSVLSPEPTHLDSKTFSTAFNSSLPREFENIGIIIVSLFLIICPSYLYSY